MHFGDYFSRKSIEADRLIFEDQAYFGVNVIHFNTIFRR